MPLPYRGLKLQPLHAHNPLLFERANESQAADNESKPICKIHVSVPFFLLRLLRMNDQIHSQSIVETTVNKYNNVILQYV